MAEENTAMQEDPTLGGDPQEAEPQKPEHSSEEISAFLSELEKAGVEKPEQLAGQLNNAKEYGNVGVMLGQERQRTSDLTTEVQSLKEEMRRMNTGNDFSEPYYNNAGADNIQDLVGNAVNDALTKREQKQAEIQQRTMRTWSKIQGDSEFANVKDVWEEKVKDPNFIMQIQAGQVDPLEAFNDMKVDFYKGMARKSLEVIKGLTGNETPGAPHVEGGDRTPQLPKAPSEKQGELQDLQARVLKGHIPSEAEELAALAGMLGG